MINCYPVKYEAYDNTDQRLVFTIEALDEYSATLKMETMVDVEAWDEISKEIRKALVKMQLGVK